jgi:hypothetical protein
MNWSKARRVKSEVLIVFAPIDMRQRSRDLVPETQKPKKPWMRNKLHTQ